MSHPKPADPAPGPKYTPPPWAQFLVAVGILVAIFGWAYFSTHSNEDGNQPVTPTNPADSEDGTVEAAIARLQGEWSLISVSTEGVAQFNRSDRGYQFRDNTLIHRFSRKVPLSPSMPKILKDELVSEQYSYRLDISRTPRSIDLTDSGGKHLLGIYRFEEPQGTLTLCYSEKQRPVEFSAPGKETFMVKLQRVSRSVK